MSAFAYYGIVLLTTELFETPDGCHGELFQVNLEISSKLFCCYDRYLYSCQISFIIMSLGNDLIYQGEYPKVLKYWDT